MQQIVQAAVLRSNEIGLQLKRLAVCCDKHSGRGMLEGEHVQWGGTLYCIIEL
jgi:hypothetical protein